MGEDDTHREDDAAPRDEHDRDGEPATEAGPDDSAQDRNDGDGAGTSEPDGDGAGTGEPDGGAAAEGDPPDGELPIEAVVTERPSEALRPMRRPLALVGTFVTGGVMGAAEVVPGFSGGTVAFVAGIYERLIAAIRQGARALSLLVRGRPKDALRALLAIDYIFVGVLLVGMLGVLFSVVGPLRTLLEERPVEMSTVFIGLVLGAAVVSSRRFRAPRAWHLLVVLAAAVVTAYGLGYTPGVLEDPNPLLFTIGGAVAATAWILPGVSGSFLLLLMGLYPAVVDAAADRAIGPLLLLGSGIVLGLAAFSTLLNWLLTRAHDLVLAVLIGVMVGSVRVLWPWPSEAGVGGSAELGAPESTQALLALALGLFAFALVYMGGLAAAAVERAQRRRAASRAEADAATTEP
ncbi:MAG: DUF368 domain-containing protein [Nitriliruptoraceae bacterium]